ncbi:class I SAM-dependent methyltransferase [Pseudoteredinibacter isoporae]|uniref:class I SAM-dependent methyltransferase n=1 Tax=Pseudoteredinibacter isoporae TaxID=570281 RepID=UPI0031032B33
MSRQREYWDLLSELGGSQSVFDPKDRFGKKNAYIKYLRDKELERFFGKNSRDRYVLDFGCGSGNISATLNSQGINTLGIDISSGLLKVAKAQSSHEAANFCQFDGLNLPLAEEIFSDIVVYVVFSYIKNDQDLRTVLSQLYACLEEGGSFLLIEQTRRIQKEVDEHKVIRTKDFYLELFSESGFECDECRDMRSGRFLPLYLLSLGVSLPYDGLHKWEVFQNNVIPSPIWDYRETVFEFRKV